MPIPLSITITERGAGGVPSSTAVALPALPTAYTHTITDRFGFESMSFSLPVRYDVALDWLANGLMRAAVVYSPDGMVVWEGFLSTISASFAQKRASVSMERVGNRVRTKYTTVLDTSGTTASASNTTSQALYGVKDVVTELDKSTATEAGYKRDRVLAALAFPRSAEASDARTGEQGDVMLELSFAGWYATLEWLIFGNTSTSTSSATTQVGSLLGTVAATNAFISTSTLDIAALGRTASAFAENDTTYRAKIEDLLGLGDTSGYPLTWGVYEGRVFRVAAWAGITPDTPTYTESAGDAFVYSKGLRVAPWDVRPNAMSFVRNLADVAPTSGAVDAAARKYVGRVTCTIDESGAGCTLEPSETADIAAQIARLR